MITKSVSFYQLIAAVLVVFLMGCSNSSDPLSPGLDVTGAKTSTFSSNTHLWGAWDVTFDPATNTAEIVPVRGTSFTANVTQFMQPPMQPVNVSDPLNHLIFVLLLRLLSSRSLQVLMLN